MTAGVGHRVSPGTMAVHVNIRGKRCKVGDLRWTKQHSGLPLYAWVDIGDDGACGTYHGAPDSDRSWHWPEECAS